MGPTRRRPPTSSPPSSSVDLKLDGEAPEPWRSGSATTPGRGRLVDVPRRSDPVSRSARGRRAVSRRSRIRPRLPAHERSKRSGRRRSRSWTGSSRSRVRQPKPMHPCRSSACCSRAIACFASTIPIGTVSEAHAALGGRAARSRPRRRWRRHALGPDRLVRRAIDSLYQADLDLKGASAMPENGAGSPRRPPRRAAQPQQHRAGPQVGGSREPPEGAAPGSSIRLPGIFRKTLCWRLSSAVRCGGRPGSCGSCPWRRPCPTASAPA